jgi:hypothetical protein
MIKSYFVEYSLAFVRSGSSAGRLQPARRRGVDSGDHLGTALLQVLQNLVNLLGIPSSLNFAVMGVVIFLGVFVDQVSGQGKKKKQVVAAAPTSPSGGPLTPSQAI